MPPAQRKTRTADKGATFSFTVRWKDSTGTPVDLTGYSARFNVYLPGREAGTPLYTYSAAVTANGYIVVDVPDEQTAAWSLGKQAYHLDVEAPNGVITRLLFGPLEVRSGVSV